MTIKPKKNKRGARGSVDDEETDAKRRNMADAADGDENEIGDSTEQPSNLELKEMLVELQISVANILRANNEFSTEIATLKNVIASQKREMDAMKTMLEKSLGQNKNLEKELVESRQKINDQEEEISELYDLQDKVEQYTRKNSLEIHGIPERVYNSTEEVILKLGEVLEVAVTPEDIEISHTLKGKGENPVILAKFISHKVKTSLYRKRTSLKSVRVSDLFPDSTAATRVESSRIFINENLTSYRRSLVKVANEKRKDGLLMSVWTIDGKIFVKTSPDGRPIRIYEQSDLDSL